MMKQWRVCTFCGFMSDFPVGIPLLAEGWKRRKMQNGKFGLACPDCCRAIDVARKAVVEEKKRRSYASPQLTQPQGLIEKIHCGGIALLAEIGQRFIRRKIRETSFAREIQVPTQLWKESENENT